MRGGNRADWLMHGGRQSLQLEGWMRRTDGTVVKRIRMTGERKEGGTEEFGGPDGVRGNVLWIGEVN